MTMCAHIWVTVSCYYYYLTFMTDRQSGQWVVNIFIRSEETMQKKNPTQKRICKYKNKDKIRKMHKYNGNSLKLTYIQAKWYIPGL